jgi:hypothetical protein
MGGLSSRQDGLEFKDTKEDTFLGVSWRDRFLAKVATGSNSPLRLLPGAVIA